MDRDRAPQVAVRHTGVHLRRVQGRQVIDRTWNVVVSVLHLDLDLNPRTVGHHRNDVQAAGFALIPCGGDLAVRVLKTGEARASVGKHKGVHEVQKQGFAVLAAQQKLEESNKK